MIVFPQSIFRCELLVLREDNWPKYIVDVRIPSLSHIWILWGWKYVIPYHVLFCFLNYLSIFYVVKQVAK